MIKIEDIKKLPLLPLKELLDVDKDAINYISWKALENDVKKDLEYIGSLSIDNHFDSDYRSLENYWSPSYPIAIHYYPNFGCKLFKKLGIESYYLVYSDFGGHVPEERGRLLQKELVVF